MEDWFAACREKWLVSSSDSLKTFYTEYKDHALMGTRHVAGRDLVHITLLPEELAAVLAQLRDAAEPAGGGAGA